jgi:hypothetical protein
MTVGLSELEWTGVDCTRAAMASSNDNMRVAVAARRIRVLKRGCDASLKRIEA